MHPKKYSQIKILDNTPKARLPQLVWKSHVSYLPQTHSQDHQFARSYTTSQRAYIELTDISSNSVTTEQQTSSSLAQLTPTRYLINDNPLPNQGISPAQQQLNQLKTTDYHIANDQTPEQTTNNYTHSQFLQFLQTLAQKLTSLPSATNSSPATALAKTTDAIAPAEPTTTSDANNTTAEPKPRTRIVYHVDPIDLTTYQHLEEIDHDHAMHDHTNDHNLFRHDDLGFGLFTTEELESTDFTETVPLTSATATATTSENTTSSEFTAINKDKDDEQLDHGLITDLDLNAVVEDSVEADTTNTVSQFVTSQQNITELDAEINKVHPQAHTIILKAKKDDELAAKKVKTELYNRKQIKLADIRTAYSHQADDHHPNTQFHVTKKYVEEHTPETNDNLNLSPTNANDTEQTLNQELNQTNNQTNDQILDKASELDPKFAAKPQDQALHQDKATTETKVTNSEAINTTSTTPVDITTSETSSVATTKTSSSNVSSSSNVNSSSSLGSNSSTSANASANANASASASSETSSNHLPLARPSFFKRHWQAIQVDIHNFIDFFHAIEQDIKRMVKIIDRKFIVAKKRTVRKIKSKSTKHKLDFFSRAIYWQTPTFQTNAVVKKFDEAKERDIRSLRLTFTNVYQYDGSIADSDIDQLNSGATIFNPASPLNPANPASIYHIDNLDTVQALTTQLQPIRQLENGSCEFEDPAPTFAQVHFNSNNRNNRNNRNSLLRLTTSNHQHYQKSKLPDQTLPLVMSYNYFHDVMIMENSETNSDNDGNLFYDTVIDQQLVNPTTEPEPELNPNSDQLNNSAYVTHATSYLNPDLTAKANLDSNLANKLEPSLSTSQPDLTNLVITKATPKRLTKSNLSKLAKLYPSYFYKGQDFLGKDFLGQDFSDQDSADQNLNLHLTTQVPTNSVLAQTPARAYHCELDLNITKLGLPSTQLPHLDVTVYPYTQVSNLDHTHSTFIHLTNTDQTRASLEAESSSAYEQFGFYQYKFVNGISVNALGLENNIYHNHEFKHFDRSLNSLLTIFQAQTYTSQLQQNSALPVSSYSLSLNDITHNPSLALDQPHLTIEQDQELEQDANWNAYLSSEFSDIPLYHLALTVIPYNEENKDYKSDKDNDSQQALDQDLDTRTDLTNNDLNNSSLQQTNIFKKPLIASFDQRIRIRYLDLFATTTILPEPEVSTDESITSIDAKYHALSNSTQADLADPANQGSQDIIVDRDHDQITVLSNLNQPVRNKLITEATLDSTPTDQTTNLVQNEQSNQANSSVVVNQTVNTVNTVNTKIATDNASSVNPLESSSKSNSNNNSNSNNPTNSTITTSLDNSISKDSSIIKKSSSSTSSNPSVANNTSASNNAHTTLNNGTSTTTSTTANTTASTTANNTDNTTTNKTTSSQTTTNEHDEPDYDALTPYQQQLHQRIPHKFVLVLLLVLISIIPGLENTSLSPGVTQIQSHYGTNVIALQSFYLCGLGLGQLFWGPHIDRWGRKAIVIVCSVLGLTINFSMIMATQGWELYLNRICQGFCFGGLGLCPTIMLKDIFSTRDFVIYNSWVVLFFLYSPALGPLWGGYVVVNLGWHWIFIILSIALAILITFFIFLIPETKPPKAYVRSNFKTTLKHYKEILTNTRALFLVTFNVGYSITVFSLPVLVPVVLLKIYGVHPNHLGFYLAFPLIFTIIGNRLNVMLVKRDLSPRKIWITASLTQSFFTIVNFTVSILFLGPPGIIASFCVNLFFNGFQLGNIQSLYLMLFPHCVATANSVMSFFRFVVPSIIVFGVSRLPKENGATLLHFDAITIITCTTLTIIYALKFKPYIDEKHEEIEHEKHMHEKEEKREIHQHLKEEKQARKQEHKLQTQHQRQVMLRAKHIKQIHQHRLYEKAVEQVEQKPLQHAIEQAHELAQQYVNHDPSVQTNDSNPTEQTNPNHKD